MGPLFGLALGGAFVPYRGLGASLALQSIFTVLPDTAPDLAPGFGKAYAYGVVAFIGLTLNLALSAGV
jgi:hypothetical protein